MREILNKLGISNRGYFEGNNVYVIEFDNANEYNKCFTKLDKADIIEEDSANSFTDMDNSSILYDNDEYSFNLTADFNNDIYKLIVLKKGDN